MKKENLNKIKRLYKEWEDSANVESWTCRRAGLVFRGREVEAIEAVAVMDASFAGYVGETLRQIIESEEGLENA